MTSARVWVVRHGETAWSRSGQHTSRTDLPLEPEGRDQAKAVGTLLAGALPAGTDFGLVLSSPRARAVETATLAGWGDRIERCDDLAEWDYGDYEGRTTDDIRTEQPDWTLWTDGVPDGETAADVGRRADRVVARARAAGGDVLCFAHGHLLRVLAARWVGLPPVGGRLLSLDPGSVGVLGWEREVPVIARWNQRPS
ncbi:MAG TPA: histidine phosphatase family protein [Acidimicrobiales bacterium]|nr:histidine phosphatase family protein [Acidimicrobiales bacterium]